MTYYLAENPWYLVAILGLLAAWFLVALRVTQDGRHLVRALVALGLAGAVLVVEQMWVTDAERIEWAVRDLAHAFARSDADAVLALLDQHVTFSMRNNTLGDEIDLATIPPLLHQVTFDFLQVSRLEASAGERTHLGKAEFRATASGTLGPSLGGRNFAGRSSWSLGFRRTQSGAWKVTRITAVELPQYTMLPLTLRNRPAPGAPPGPGSVAPPTPVAPSDRDGPRGLRRGRREP